MNAAEKWIRKRNGKEHWKARKLVNNQDNKLLSLRNLM
jgi:hypothetical protein